jgi:undecaprenyl-diphosphatase
VTIIQSILLGAMQGITEFLPISSSAHLIVIPWFFSIYEGSVDKLYFDVMVHVGTAFALLAVFTGRIYFTCVEDLKKMRSGDFSDATILKIAVGTVPAAIGGLFFQDVIEVYLRTPYVVIFSLIIVSLLMILAERIHLYNREVTYGVALIIGIAQAIALVPGVSRSGITITAGILLGLKRREAVDFAFLLSIPIVIAAAAYEGRHIDFLNAPESTIYVVGAFSSFIFGVVSLVFLIEYLKTHFLDVFAFYRVGLAIVILIFVALRYQT